MDITIRINTDNADFEESPRHALKNLLWQAGGLTDAFDGEAHSINLRDSNGNTVGTAEITALETVELL